MTNDDGDMGIMSLCHHLIASFYHHIITPSDHLRVLGLPNPEQSFGRGVCGPQATGACQGRSEVALPKRERKLSKIRLVTGKWPLWGRHQFGSALDLAWIFWIIQLFSKLQLPVAKMKICRLRLGTQKLSTCRIF